MRLRAAPPERSRRRIVFPTMPMMGRKGGFVRRRAKRRRAREDDPREDFAARMVPLRSGPARCMNCFRVLNLSKTAPLFHQRSSGKQCIAHGAG